MNPLSDNQLTPRHSTRPPAEQATPARAPTRRDGQAVIDRNLARIVTPGTPVPPDDACAVLPEDPDTSAAPSLAQHLPALVLDKIFSYLTPGDQCRCARVCRYWNSCLLPPQERLTRWLKQNHPVSYRAQSGWGQGFLSRTRPFLQAAHSPLMPALMQVQQEQQEHRLAAPRQEAGLTGALPRDLLSRLVHYSLNSQLTQAHQLTLRPAAVQLPDDNPTDFFEFSHCSRWLAMRCLAQGTGPDILRLYGWENDVWRPCQLTHGPPESVSDFCFAWTPQDMLVSVHGRHLLGWRRESDTNRWHHTPMHLVPQSHRLESFCALANGDWITMALNETKHEGLSHLLSFHSWRDGTWHTVTARHMTFSAWATAGHASQLVLGGVVQQGQACCINRVLIWRKGLNTSNPEQWGCQASTLPRLDGILKDLTCSPEGTYILGMLTCGQGCLWKLDEHCRLLPLLTLPNCLPASQTMPHPIYTVYSAYPVAFSADQKQLALPLSTRQIQLCYRDDHGNWQRGQILEAPFPADNRLDREPLTIKMSPTGNILVRVTTTSLDIWHRRASGHWHHSLRRMNREGSPYPVAACIAKAGELVYTTAQDPTLSLWIHGPDSCGRLVRKSCMAVAVSICGTSPDGLSLVVSSTEAPPCLLQMTPAQDRQASQQTHAEPSGKCRLL